MQPDALPPIDGPPYWRPITPEALCAKAGTFLPSDFFSVAPGWTLAELTIAGIDGSRVPRFGWVKGAFAVIVEMIDGEPVGNLTHLPSGRLISHVAPKGHTALVAEIITLLCDWETLTMADAPGIKVGQALAGAGFERFSVRTHSHGLVHVLVRTATLQ